jgi:flagellar M-ring protein FliF
MSEMPLSMSRTKGGFRVNRRFLALGVAVLLVGGVWYASRWISAPTYMTLYRDLDLNEAGTIAERLGKGGIPYRLEAGGTEVMVPVAEAARARVTLAKDGLPQNGRPGLELFDKPSWGMTDFTQRVTFQRALEGELARTIGGLQGIERAQVHLVMSTSSPLRRLERPAGASVVLKLKAGAVLSPDAVQGITYIVSNSVEQLSSDNVAVMDDAGRVLSVPSAAGSIAGLTSRQLEFQRTTEGRLTEKIEALLGTVLGAGRTRAQVAAQLSFDQVDETVETFDPDGQVLQTEQRSETGAGADAAGTQTVVSNAYQNSRRTEKRAAAVGTVTRLTIAVLVDEKALRATPTVRLEGIEGMVRDAVGADSTRGDRVTVMAVPFEQATLPVPPGGTSSQDKPKVEPLQLVERYGRPAVNLVAIIILALIALQAVRMMGSPRGAAAPGGTESAPIFEAPLLSSPVANSPAAQLRNRLQAETAERPETMAQVLRAWLSEN